MLVCFVRYRKFCIPFFSVLFSLFCSWVTATTVPEWQLKHNKESALLHLKLPPLALLTVPEYPNAYIPNLATATYLAPTGMPDLPVLAYEVLLNSEKSALLLALHAEDSTLTDINIVPAREPRIVGHPLKPRIAGEVYHQDLYTPAERVTLSPPYYVNGAWRQTVYVYPYTYNPVRRELRAAKTITIELKGVQQSTAPHRGRVRGLFTSEENGALLIVTPAHYLSTLQPFVAWKRERGLIVETLIYGSALEGYPHVTDTTALQQYIRTRYAKSGEPLKFVLLVGNRTEVPPLRRDAPAGVKADSDQAYGQIIGDDPYNEVYVGRFSAYEVEHLKTQVERVLWYERDMRHYEIGYNRGLCIASNEGAMIGDNNETDLQHTEKIRALLLNRGYTSVDLLADENNKAVVAEQVSEVVNRGVGVITYVGHGFPNRWKTSHFSNSDVQALESNSTYPVIFNTACDNGNMEAAKCFAEAWLWAQRSGKPTGAIGINASSEAQFWDAPMRGQDAMVEYFTKQRELPYVVTLGGIMNAGMKDMLLVYGSAPKSTGRITAETWNIFGDPTVVLRTKAPEILNVSHPNELLVSERSFEIHCPSEQIQATLKLTYPSGEVIYDNAEFISGRARFTGLTLVKDAVAHITVWGVNKETYTADLPCIENTSSPLRVKTFWLKSKTTNMTGLVGAGETWEVWGSFVYQGTTPPLAGVRAYLSVQPQTSGTITPTEGVALPTFNTPAQEEELKLGEVKISDILANGDKFILELTLRNGETIIAKRSMSVIVTASRATIDSAWATSTLTVRPGAMLPLRVQITNRGLGEFKDGELRFYWKNSPSPIIQNIPSISTGQGLAVAQNIVIPTPLASLQKAVLCVELWKGSYKHATKELMVVGGLPITPVLSYDDRYPFATTTTVYQETFFYFDKPRFLEKGGRLLTVQLPIHYAAPSLVLNNFYIEVLRRIDLTDLSKVSIDPIPPEKAFSGEFPIRNGIITLPLEPYDYNTFESDLILRIRSQDNSKLGEYFIPAHKQAYTGVLVRREWSNGKLDTITSRSLPLLRFETAEEVPFTFTVLDEQDLPCTNAELTIYGEKYTTDAAGKVTISPLWEGNYDVTVFSSLHGLQTFELALRKETPNYTLQLKAPRLLDLTCILTSRSGERIADALIRIGGNEYYTGSNGTVSIQVLEGLREFWVYADGYEGEKFVLRITNQQKEYELILSPRERAAVFEVLCTPNPTHGDLYLSSRSIMSEVRLFAIDGSLIANYKLHGYNYILGIQNLPRGLYIVEVRGNEPKQLTRMRIVKDR